MTDRMILECEHCGNEIVLAMTDPKALENVLCDCTHEMKLVGFENTQ